MSDYLNKIQDLYKAQKIQNPWAVAWSIITGNSKKKGKHLDAVRQLHEDYIKAAKTGEEKRALAG